MGRKSFSQLRRRGGAGALALTLAVLLLGGCAAGLSTLGPGMQEVAMNWALDPAVAIGPDSQELPVIIFPPACFVDTTPVTPVVVYRPTEVAVELRVEVGTCLTGGEPSKRTVGLTEPLGNRAVVPLSRVAYQIPFYYKVLWGLATPSPTPEPTPKNGP